MGKTSIKTIIVDEDDTVMITTPDANGRTCVYCRLIDGKLMFEGGGSIVHPDTFMEPIGNGG